MEGGYMFGALHSFLEQDFFEKHRHGELIVGDIAYEIEIFAVLDTEATQAHIFAPTEYRQEEVLEYIQKNAAICDRTLCDRREEGKKGDNSYEEKKNHVHFGGSSPDGSDDAAMHAGYGSRLHGDSRRHHHF